MIGLGACIFRAWRAVAPPSAFVGKLRANHQGGTEAHNPAAVHSSQVLFRPGAGCYALSSGGELRGSRPAGTNGLNDDVVNDGADARRKFCSESGRFLLLDRVDKPP